MSPSVRVRTAPPQHEPVGARPRGPAWPAVLLGVLVACLCLGQLFVGRDVGLADNGDGTRLMCQVHLQADPTQYFHSSQFSYDAAGAQARADCLGSPVWRYPTSWLLVLGPVVAVHRLTSGTTAYDLRLSGVVASLLLGLGVGLLAAGVRPRGPVGWVALAAVGVLVVDLSWTAYFSAPYPEAGGFAGLLALLGALAWTASRPLHGRSVIALAVLGLAVGTVKSQLAPVALLVAAVLVVAALWRGSAASTRVRVGAAVAAAAVALGTVGYLGAAGSEFRDVNRYDLLFATILHGSPSPSADLADLGLPVGLARYAGTTAFSTDNAFADPEYRQVERHFGRVQALRFWVTHPGRGREALLTALRDVPTPQLNYLSTVVQDPAAPPQVPRRLDASVRLLGALGHLGPWTLLGLWVATAALGAWATLRRERPAQVRGLGAVVAFLAVSAAGQVAVSLLGDGYYELAKHLVFASYCTAVLLPLAAWLVVTLLAPATRRHPLLKTASAPDSGQTGSC